VKLGFAFLLLLCASIRTEDAVTEPAALDVYGGTTAIRGQATGYFHLEKIGPQWVFITPDGNGLYPLTVAAIYFNHPGFNAENKTYTQVVDTKYRKEGDQGNTPARERWGDKVRDRLRQWGFTGVGPYSFEPVVPNFSAKNTYYLGNKIPGLPSNAMPFVATQNNIYYPMRDGTVHNIWGPLSGKEGEVGQAMFADVFDPKFAQAVEKMAESESMSDQQKKWVLFAFIEQTDYMRGVLKSHPHLGWACAATNFELKEGICEAFTNKKATYEDPKIYTKYALRDFLKAKYETIDKINAAWETKYTSWDSEGGWAKGSGFLDEDGRGIGPLRDFFTKGKPAIVKDLNVFAAKVIRQFFKTVYEIRKKACPEILLSTNNFGKAHDYVIEGLVSEDGLTTYADVICRFSDTSSAAEEYARLKRPFFVVSIFGPQAPNDSPLGYRGKVKSVQYEDVLKKKGENGKAIVDRSSDPTKYPDAEVDHHASRVIVQAEHVDFWWAKHNRLKIPYRTFTKFSSALNFRTSAGEFKDVSWASRPWDSMDWLARDTFAVHETVPFGYFHLKKTLKAGDALWRTQPGGAETQEGRGEIYRNQTQDVVDFKADNGDYVFVGFNFWAWWDTSWTGIIWDEAFNCGLVTFNDNAYDGKEAVFEKTMDKDGYPIGGETRPPHMAEKKGFGDFISSVTGVNREILDSVTKRAKKQ
jgi:hypothetical protein